MGCPKILASWSSGKDSAWMLHVLRQQGHRVGGLLTMINDQSARVSMHGVSTSLLAAQAAAVGLPCTTVPLPHPCSNEQYEAGLRQALAAAAANGYTHVAFGDLFLEDVRAYREAQLRDSRLEPIFPLWQSSTDELAWTMLRAGVAATVTCVDPRRLSPSTAGAKFDAELLASLPPTIDPCGERGEFHTFAWAGPMFSTPLDVEVAGRLARDGFVFADIRARPSRPGTACGPDSIPADDG